MSEKSLDTEQKILAAAKKVFTQKGMDGARMQEIADEAEINKALLHYYFRSKDKLFDAVIEEIITNAIPTYSAILQEETPLNQRIAKIIPYYYNVMAENPFLPPFIVHELNKNPQRLFKMLNIDKIQHISAAIQQDLKNQLPPQIQPAQILVSIVAATIFPYLTRPIIEKILLEPTQTHWDDFLKSRPDFIINLVQSIIPNPKNY